MVLSAKREIKRYRPQSIFFMIFYFFVSYILRIIRLTSCAGSYLQRFSFQNGINRIFVGNFDASLQATHLMTTFEGLSWFFQIPQQCANTSVGLTPLLAVRRIMRNYLFFLSLRYWCSLETVTKATQQETDIRSKTAKTASVGGLQMQIGRTENANANANI